MSSRFHYEMKKHNCVLNVSLINLHLLFMGFYWINERFFPFFLIFFVQNFFVHSLLACKFLYWAWFFLLIKFFVFHFDIFIIKILLIFSLWSLICILFKRSRILIIFHNYNFVDFLNILNKLILLLVFSIKQSKAFHYLTESERLFDLILLLVIGWT